MLGSTNTHQAHFLLSNQHIQHVTILLDSFHSTTSAHTPLHRTGNMHLFAHNTSPPSCTSAQKYPYILVGTMAAILDLKLPRYLCMNNGCHLGFTNPLLMPHIPRDRHAKTSKSPTYWGQRELPISF